MIYSTLQKDQIYFSQIENQLINGDLRISFKYAPCNDATVLAKAIANTFVTWQFNDKLNATVDKDYNNTTERTCCQETPEELKPVKEIFWIFNGLFTSEECFSKFIKENSSLIWFLRGIAYLLMATGVIILLKLMETLERLVPIDDLKGITFILFNIAAAIPLTLFIMSFAWIYYRPKIGIGMFLLSFALAGGVYYYAYKHS